MWEGEYYWVAHSTGPIPNETQIPCQTPVARLATSQELLDCNHSNAQTFKR